jgi:hypothetical protein
MNTLKFIIIFLGIFFVTFVNSIEIYKTPTCGCCNKYADFLESKKFKINRVDLIKLKKVKKKYKIPYEMQSCHTTVFKNYFVEGHVPLKAINKLLDEMPDIDGISLPGMPIGTPGMPGKKKSPFIIYQIKDGEYKEFITI